MSRRPKKLLGTVLDLTTKEESASKEIATKVAPLHVYV